VPISSPAVFRQGAVINIFLKFPFNFTFFWTSFRTVFWIFGWVSYNRSMSTPMLATKLYIPPPRPKVVLRPHLLKRLNEGLRQNQGLGRKLTLISAPAGFGKTTLVSEWVAGFERPAAWLSLDEGDNDPTRFLSYLVAALRTIVADIGEGVLTVLQSPQPPPIASILTPLLNEITPIPDDLVLVLDDYHVIDAGGPLGAVDANLVDGATSVDDALTFLLEHSPPQLHLVIVTREDPNLPLARLRARGQLTELRVTDLQFTSAEAAEFLNQVMGLALSAEDIAVLESRTEGWIVGLQLAALALQGTISMQGHQDSNSFINSFSGRHHFVLDYLVEEVLQQQSASVQTFLLQTAILDRLCGPLCDAVLLDTSTSGQETLEYIEQNNLFLVPLDNERRWYRYHHLFADLLRQRLYQSTNSALGDKVGMDVAELHIRASAWYENNGLEIEAFTHAAAANDIARAERLVEGDGMPLHFRGAGTYVLNWLEALPETALNARPSLWVMYASTLLFTGQHTAVEQKLQAAEAALQDAEHSTDDKTRDLLGRIAAMRATLAVIQNDVETIIAQSLRAQEYLHPDNLIFRTTVTWTLGLAHQLKGDRAAASRAYAETIAIGGDSIYTTAATITLGQIQESETQLSLATRTYQSGLDLAGDPPHPIACEAFLGLARIYYEWNDLDAAQEYGQQCLQLTQQMENVDTFAAYGVFLARLLLAQGDVPGAVDVLKEAEAFVQRQNFAFRMAEIAAAQVRTLLRQGDLAAAATLARQHELPLSQAWVCLAQGDPAAALAVLEPLRRQMDKKGWRDEQLKIMLLQAVAYDAVAAQAGGETDKAVQQLAEALALAEPEGYIRIFVDEGLPMARLLSAATDRGIRPDYVSKLLAAFAVDKQVEKQESVSPPTQALVDPLSERELEILTLIAAGLKNKEIAAQLFISLNTVLYHVKNIYGKLGVNKRTLALIKARELNLLPDA